MPLPELPISDTVVRPAVLAGHTNGRLPDAILVDTPGQAGGAVVRLVEPAARAWRALAAAAKPAGHILKPTSLYDSYRPYDIQERIFRQRYTTSVLSGRPRRWWDPPGAEPAAWWYQRPDTAPAAVPGTSNHGLGLAVDVGEERDGDTGTESIDVLTLQWLVDHELGYGFSHELQVEPWHIRYWTGDQIPAAVLAYEEDDVEITTRVPWNGGAQQARMVAAGWSADGLTVGQLLTYTFESSRHIAPGMAAKLAEILDAALDDGDTSVVLPPEAITELTALRDAVAALPDTAEVRDAIADQAEGGAAAVRADTD